MYKRKFDHQHPPEMPLALNMIDKCQVISAVATDIVWKACRRRCIGAGFIIERSWVRNQPTIDDTSKIPLPIFSSHPCQLTSHPKAPDYLIYPMMFLFSYPSLYSKKSVSPFLINVSKPSSIGVSPPTRSMPSPAASSLSTNKARTLATSSRFQDVLVSHICYYSQRKDTHRNRGW